MHLRLQYKFLTNSLPTADTPELYSTQVLHPLNNCPKLREFHTQRRIFLSSSSRTAPCTQLSCPQRWSFFHKMKKLVSPAWQWLSIIRKGMKILWPRLSLYFKLDVYTKKIRITGCTLSTFPVVLVFFSLYQNWLQSVPLLCLIMQRTPLIFFYKFYQNFIMVK